ncbi:MAG: hypothetical protein ABI846_03575 [Rudaea sp.]
MHRQRADQPPAHTLRVDAQDRGPQGRRREAAWVGCYEITFSGFDSAALHSIECWRVSDPHVAEYDVESATAPTPAVPHMKNTTADEMQTVGNAFGLGLSDGLSMKWDKDAPNQNPVGRYIDVDGAREQRVPALVFSGQRLREAVRTSLAVVRAASSRSPPVVASCGSDGARVRLPRRPSPDPRAWGRACARR